MQETLPQLPVMPLSEFLTVLFRALFEQGVQYCVLRNYEGFPGFNAGRDVDLLVRASDLPLAIQTLRSIPGTRVVGYFERRYVASVFLQGISSTAKARALQIDFDLSLTWKGLAYLPADVVLQAAIPHPAANLIFPVPSPIHEAITSLMTSDIASAAADSSSVKYPTILENTTPASCRLATSYMRAPQIIIKG